MSIKPCPFCGEEDDLEVGHGTKDREGWPVWIYCVTCGMQGPWYYNSSKSHLDNIETVIVNSGWNSRAQQ